MRKVVPVRPLAPVIWHCQCGACACVAEVSRSGAACGNCANGNHHNLITR